MLQFKGLRATRERLIVSDSQVDRQIDRLLEQNTRTIPVSGRPSQPDDELVLDYAGFADGVQFEGGTAQKQTLVLGSGTFIPGFEEQLVGKNVGDDVDVNVTFPAQYHAPALAGKAAVFKCHIHEVRVRQRYAPDDAFAREVGGCDSFGAFKARLREGMQAYADAQAEEDLKAQLLDQLLKDYDCAVSDEELERALTLQLKALEGQLARQGLTLDAYRQFTNQTEEQLRQSCVPDARRAVRRQRLIAEIAEAEGIEADEASVAEAIQRICRENGMTVEQFTPYLDEAGQTAIARGVVTDKVLNLIRDSAVINTVEKRA